MSPGKNSNKPFKWEELASSLVDKLSAIPSTEQLKLLQDTSWVEDYVQQVLSKSLPDLNSINRNNSHQAEVFDTHNYVIVKLKISEKLNPIVKVRTDQVRIDGTEDSVKKIVRLPCLVVPSSSRSSYKDGILQIKMRKRKFGKDYHEVPVRYL